MLDANERPREKEEYPLLSNMCRTETLPSLTQPHTAAAADAITTTAFPKTAGQNGLGSSIIEDGGKGLWEPCYQDGFSPPDIASPTEFPQLMQPYLIFKKKM